MNAWRHNSLRGRVIRAKNFLVGLSSEPSLTPQAERQAEKLNKEFDKLISLMEKRNDALTK
jgi:hypothetical protein